MEQSYTRQSKLIKRINLAVWALLFLAGTILCQRVLSDHSVQEVAMVSNGSSEDEPASDGEPVSDPSNGETQSEEEIVDEDAPQTVENAQSEINDDTWTAPPRRVRPTVTKPTVTPTKPAVLATSPITSHASNNSPIKTPKKSGSKDVAPTAQEKTKSPQETLATTTTKAPIRSFIETPPRDSEPSTPIRAPQKPATVKAKEPSQTPKQTLPKVNPRRLVVENPKKIGYPVSFLVGDNQQTLRPGEKFERTLDTTNSAANIHFDRGGNFGEAILDLKPGNYEFKVTRQGWTIVPQNE